MPTTTQINIFDLSVLLAIVKVAILLILSFYAVFSLIVVRQVDLMSRALITSVSPVVKAFAILHAGLAIGLVFLAFGIL